MKSNLTFILIIAVIVGLIFLPGRLKQGSLERKKARLERQIAELQKSNKALGDEKYKLQHDPFYIEKTAREQMGVAKEGEIVIKLKRDEK